MKLGLRCSVKWPPGSSTNLTLNSAPILTNNQHFLFLVLRSSSSKSRSPSPARRLMYITSFGGSDEEGEAVQGPLLPPHLRLGSSSNRKNTSRSVLLSLILLMLWTHTHYTFLGGLRKEKKRVLEDLFCGTDPLIKTDVEAAWPLFLRTNFPSTVCGKWTFRFVAREHLWQVNIWVYGKRTFWRFCQVNIFVLVLKLHVGTFVGDKFVVGSTLGCSKYGEFFLVLSVVI